ncbi:YciI family protein [Microbacterium fluvii]|uniref:YciI family protein n=1 Tax=Microbacterium fluvii TaxID=415215 RepID=A0ABW2HBX3_9MICO|nr:YciI family protein [Microbacterium fluvii]MCU4671572.1 YciI family protein [Microbacterium fluvii]
MKYVIMFTSTPELDAQVSPEAGQELYGRVYTWFQEHDADITDGGAELLPADTATTVRGGGVVVDGPFSEAKEVIGGFSIIDVADMDAAVTLVKSWPMLELPGTSVEIRPIVTDYSQFEQ